MRFFALIATALLMLTACSDKPSNAEIKQAIEARMHAEIEKEKELREQMEVRPEVLAAMGEMPGAGEVYIEALEVKELTRNEAGEYVGKVDFVAHIGERTQDISDVIKVQRVEGKWQVSDL